MVRDHSRIIRKLTGLLVLLFHACLFGDEPTTIDYNYRIKFKPGHNLSLLLTARQSDWYADSQNDSVKLNGMSTELQFRYAFHINMLGRFGILFGTTTGVGYDVVQKNSFKPGVGIYLPTMMFGLVNLISQDTRLILGVEYGAIWYNKIQLYLNNQNLILIETPHTFNLYFGSESFLSKSFALGIQVGYRYTSNINLDIFSETPHNFYYYIKNYGYYLSFTFNWEILESLGF